MFKVLWDTPVRLFVGWSFTRVYTALRNWVQTVQTVQNSFSLRFVLSLTLGQNIGGRVVEVTTMKLVTRTFKAQFYSCILTIYSIYYNDEGKWWSLEFKACLILPFFKIFLGTIFFKSFLTGHEDQLLTFRFGYEQQPTMGVSHQTLPLVNNQWKKPFPPNFPTVICAPHASRRN